MTVFRAYILFFISAVGLPQAGISQGKSTFSFRVGVIGSATTHESLWLFNNGSASSQQNFKFGGSTGVVVDVDYHFAPKWRFGLHTTIAQTNFNITFPSISLSAPNDQTTQNQIALELKFLPFNHRTLKPFFGVNGGFLLTRDIKLVSNMSRDKITMVNSPIYGVTLGMDYFIVSNKWALHFIMRAQSVNFIFDESNFTFRQTLFQDSGWANHNHWQFGVSRIF